jgi:colanic acid/amylovoran biosynthesis glycosyltransferase
VGRGFSNSITTSLQRKVGDPAERALVVATDRFPVPSETFVRNEIGALRGLGWAVRVEAVGRPDQPLLGGARGLDVHYLEDEGHFARAVATAWLVLRHPLRCLADRRTAGRWGPERLPLSAIAPQAWRLANAGERHVHVHFAALAAVNSLRAGALVGVRVSFIGHGHEVFVTPNALSAKLGAAAFAAGPCEYTARHLRQLAPPDHETRVESIVMGVDGSRWRRAVPHQGGRTVVAVGRLVEKKGFTHLVEALARPEGAEVERLRIAGDGPLMPALREQIRRSGLEDRVELLGALGADAVRDLLEGADVVAVPCVIATDGDRDAMPVVAKEALAMEVPVVASREVGLPELIRDEWGRLVPPGDSAALAEGLAELLSLPASERAAMGAAGRAFVLDHFSLDAEADRLARLVLAR